MIDNKGEKTFEAHTDDGAVSEITAQVCDVNKALLSVKRVIGKGNRVVFDEEGSYIEDKKIGQAHWLEEKNGMFILKLWVHRGQGVQGPF